jgi:hypothetical protein
MYSLGIVAYELASGGMWVVYLRVCLCFLLFFEGVHPFAGASGRVNITKVVTGDHSELVGREYSDELKGLIYRMMDMV